MYAKTNLVQTTTTYIWDRRRRQDDNKGKISLEKIGQPRQINTIEKRTEDIIRKRQTRPYKTRQGEEKDGPDEAIQ